MQVLFDSSGHPIRLGALIGQGGEAAVYRVEGSPSEIAKLYQPAPRPDYTQKLAWMVSHPPQNPTWRQEHPSLAWPDALLFHPDGRLAGYRMPFIRPALPILDVFNPRRRKVILPRFDRRYLHRTARNLSNAVGALHACSYVAGDLNESNVLVTPAALVTVIDTDSFQVIAANTDTRAVYPCPVGKPEYLPPELQGKPLASQERTPAQDAFPLGVLIFQLLMEGSHPFRAQWLGRGDPPSIEERIARGAFPYTGSPNAPVRPPYNAPDLHRLHPALAELTRRCFIDGASQPDLRPTPSTWERAIIEAEAALVSCPRGHVYSSHLGACPDCPPELRHAPARSFRPARAERKAATDPVRTQPSRPVKPAPRRTAAPARPWPAQPIRMPSRQAVISWAGQRIIKSVLIGGGLGAAAGALPALLLAAASHSAGETAALTLLIALGGATGGLLRGWEPGYRLGGWLDRHLRFPWLWQGAGMLVGGAVGTALGLVFWWAIFPVVLGLVLGARAGAEAGKLLWQAANRIGWGRIWAALGGAGAGYLGWQIGSWAARGGLDQLLFSWLPADLFGVAWAWLLAGALSGALGGALAGVTADLLARLVGLRD